MQIRNTHSAAKKGATTQSNNKTLPDLIDANASNGRKASKKLCCTFRRLVFRIKIRRCMGHCSVDHCWTADAKQVKKFPCFQHKK